MTRGYLRRRADGRCAMPDCPRPAYADYARCNHHRHARDHYHLDEVPTRPEPEHGTLARYRGSSTRPPCHCDLCRAENTRRHREWLDQQRRAS